MCLFTTRIHLVIQTCLIPFLICAHASAAGLVAVLYKYYTIVEVVLSTYGFNDSSRTYHEIILSTIILSQIELFYCISFISVQ